MPHSNSDRDPASGDENHRRLRPSGGYRRLRSFQTATLIYDGTVSFCNRFVNRSSRTHDQMVQAARSGRQNIAEGNRAGAVSSKSEMNLTTVARASLDELLLDFQDYLRQRKWPLWSKNDPAAQAVRAVGLRLGRLAAQPTPPDPTDPTDQTDQTDQTDHPPNIPAAHLLDPEDAGDRARYALYAPWLENEDSIVVANALICLIHQTNFLLDQQLPALEQDFVEHGGFTEQLAAARIQHRSQSDRSREADRTDRSFPKCPTCGKLMTLRTARQGKNAGLQFWGCTGYPACKGRQPLEPKSRPNHL